MEKLLVVDGSNLLFQMFYGMPARIVDKQGRPIQGTIGFVGALLKIIRMTRPTHAVVVFDGEVENPRGELDESYKGNRPDYSQMPEEDTPFSQLHDIYAALDYLGIRHRETSVCEADDWMAGYAKQYGGTLDVVISSQDSDLFQLITDRVHILRYRGEKTVLCDPGYIREKLGITPEQYAGYKSLTGDSSDNIKGADKIGPKTAAALMNQFGDLDALIARAAEIQKPSIRASVIENAERIRKNHKLIYLDGVQELPFSLEELCYQYSGVTSREVLSGIGL
ncbi:MAG: flap endonuclease [Oscillospiraceae bacterium]|nr:flap endonuclease [Oscillospiraceae bacterium]